MDPKRTVQAVFAGLLALIGVVSTGAVSAAQSDELASDLVWFPCFESTAELWEGIFPESAPVDFECAFMPVPLDYDEPDGDTAVIAVIRLPARDQDDKIGSLVTNPGGPGSSGVEFVANGGPLIFEDLRNDFDIIGFDPRGVRFSSPLLCFETEAELFESFSGVATPRNYGQLLEWRASDQAMQEACSERGGPILDHMSTGNVARDMDVLRASLGDDELTYVGYSYGTMIGATYANLFPDNVRAMYLDSAIDPVAYTTGRGNAETTPVGLRMGSDVGSHAALDELFQLCRDAGTESCAIAEDPVGRWVAARDDLDANPLILEVPVYDEQGEIIATTEVEYGGDDFVRENVGLLYNEYEWPIVPELVVTVEQLLAPDVSAAMLAQFGDDIGALRADLPNDLSERADVDPNADENVLYNAYQQEFYPNIEAFAGVYCSDSVNSGSFSSWRDASNRAEANSFFGWMWTWNTSDCLGWPGEDADAYHGPWDADTSNTILIANTSFDPTTPLQGAQRMNDALRNSVLIESREGRGHIAEFTSDCVLEARTSYLLTGDIPDVTGCEPTIETPFE